MPCHKTVRVVDDQFFWDIQRKQTLPCGTEGKRSKSWALPDVAGQEAGMGYTSMNICTNTGKELTLARHSLLFCN